MFAGIGAAAGGLIGGIANAITGSQQLKLQREQFAYQKQLNDTMMQREDSAVQRRMADLEQAGLSKNLATGAGFSAQTTPGSAGNPVGAGGAGQMTEGLNSVGQSIGTGLNAARSFQEIINAQAQAKNINANTSLQMAQVITEGKKQGLIDSEVASNALNTAIAEYNLGLSRSAGIRTGDSMSEDTFRGKTMMLPGTSFWDILKYSGFKAGDALQGMLTFGNFGGRNPKSPDKRRMERELNQMFKKFDKK